jgi:hypothetical protein
MKTYLWGLVIFSCLNIYSEGSANVFELSPIDQPAIISNGLQNTNKVKMLMMPDRTLIAIYGMGQPGVQVSYDLKSRTTRAPWDLVAQYSTDEGVTWSAPVNFDNTAMNSSSKGIIESTGPPPLFPPGNPNEGYVDLLSDPRAIDFPGDSDKPQAFNAGNNIVVTFNSKFCPQNQIAWPGEEHRFITYLELNGITIPYSCLWISRLQWNPSTQSFRPIGDLGAVYITEQFTSGFRDVKQDVPIPQSPGFGVIWQEDPLGLQLGEGDGPGTGASGANTTGGTDLYYTFLDTNNNSTPDFVANRFAAPVRLTKNTSMQNELQGPNKTSHGPGVYDDGKAAAARANIRLIGRRAFVAWEEKKSTAGIDEGKYIRYHTWPEFTDTTSLPINGCIISKPLENARRVRLLTQSLSTGQTGVVFIYKQGDFSEGGPSDIMLRRAVGGYDPLNILPAVDAEITGMFGERCRAHVNNADDDIIGDDELMDNPLIDIRVGTAHLNAMNFSGSENYEDLPSTAPDAGTGLNPFENSLAHRGQMKGDKIVIGFSHAPDQARFDFLSDSIPYNFYIRNSQDGGATWSTAFDFSGLTTADGVSVREPRIVGTAGNGPGCADPMNPVDATDCQNKDIMYAGFGTQTNVTNVETTEDVDIYMGFTKDAGQSYSLIQSITAGDALSGMPDDVPDFETQLKIRPDGQQAFVVWTSAPLATEDVAFRELKVNDIIFANSFE